MEEDGAATVSGVCQVAVRYAIFGVAFSFVGLLNDFIVACSIWGITIVTVVARVDTLERQGLRAHLCNTDDVFS